MFDHVVMRRSLGGQPISAGQVAEALLFYQKVHLVIDRGTLLGLVKQVGMPQLLTLLNRSDFSAVYCEEMLATSTDTVGAIQIHDLVALTFAGDPVAGNLKTVEDRLRFDLSRAGLSNSEAKRSTKAFLDRVPVRKFSGDHFIKGGVTDAARQDVLDSDYIRKAIHQVLQVIPGGYDTGPDLKFDVINSKLGLHVFTDIDFEAINRRRALIKPTEDPLSQAHLLTNVLEARADLALASFYGGDFITSAANSSIIKVRYSEILRRSTLNADSLQNFIEVTLPDAKTVAEIIDSGERTFSEFLILLDKAARFKTWAKTVNPDENLVRTYMRDVLSEGWIQRLPQKCIRYAITLALDASNPIAGLAAGFVDNFVLEKLLSGWRPNHFIDTRLKPFIRST
ncbi:hypothetical protein P245_25895 [Comamonas thiooxydans]|uniref:Uncharacterized protein n=1 Tax=Comamonas thiooxydans TaxID=363952 RepID=A0A0E3BV54_9BURK|nr:hypothetical protein [Comamonas thiooxydans]KGG83045.1 hypothetical protein P245_25895 [Comamonas thiooxydans]